MTKTPAWGETRESVAEWCAPQDAKRWLPGVDALHISILVNGNDDPAELYDLAHEYERAQGELHQALHGDDQHRIREADVNAWDLFETWYGELRTILWPDRVAAEQDKILADAGYNLD